MKLKLSIFVLLSILAGCSKSEQKQETSFSLIVSDITTGNTENPALIDLVEIETPTSPFTSINEVVVDQFNVEFNELLNQSFYAKRGDRFEYKLRFNRQDKTYGNSIITDGFYYETIDEVTLSKKTVNECSLQIVPICEVTSYAKNIAPASEDDSIWVELTDGRISDRLGYKGANESPSGTTKMAHGYYTLSCQVYQSGELISSDSSEVYLHHGRDTTMVFEF